MVLQKADAELAYELQSAKTTQKIRAEEIEIDVVERRKQISVEEKEIDRKEKELHATIKLPAEAEAYRVNQIAEGKRWVVSLSSTNKRKCLCLIVNFSFSLNSC
jgi:flotillin